jgi:hypothetical protein
VPEVISAVIAGASIDANAYIAAGAAILGALVGGAATGTATYLVEKKRQAHATATVAASEQQVARAIARVLFEDLARAASLATTTRSKDIWIRAEIFPRTMPPEDRRELYGYLTASEYAAVAKALAAIDGLDALTRASRGADDPPPPSAHAELFEQVETLTQAALERLRRLTESD